MPVFATPEPITLDLDLAVGRVHIVASERDEATVSVAPGDSDRPGDLRAARDVRVDFAAGVLSLVATKTWRFIGPGDHQIDVEISLPSGSDLRGKISAGSLTVDGRIGGCSFRVGAGDIRLDATGRLALYTGAGSITVGHAVGEATIGTGAGSIRVGTLDGDAEIKNVTGSTTLGTVTGSLTVKGGHGDIVIDRVVDRADVRSGYAGIRIDRVEGGEVHLENGYGPIEIGVPEGVAAWLDVSSQHGPVTNELDSVASPADTDRTAQIIAHNNWGSIVIRRPLT
jgi:hypothetical protein